MTGSDKYTLIETGTDAAGAVNISVDGLADVQEVTTRDARTGAKHEVADPRLTDAEVAAVQDEVFRQLGWE